MTFDMIKSEERLNQFCTWANCNAPKVLRDEDGAMSQELLEFCEKEDCSLDWVFRGDLKSLFHTGRKTELAALKDRIQLLSACRDVQPVEVKADEYGDPLVTPELMQWAKENGACINWLFAGDLSTIVASSARDNLLRNQMLDVVKPYTEDEMRALVVTLQGVTQGRISIADAMTAFREAKLGNRDAA